MSARVYGVTCSGCGSSMLRGEGDARICSRCETEHAVLADR
ncbi:hypothetical protein [Halobaculum magnesiiphilum]|nr:hypothetical protein [Halobaculum magnesiiphilum]